LIRQTQVPVVPCAVAGAWHAWPRWRLIPTLAPLFLPPSDATIAVSVGPPLDGLHLAKLERDEMLRELSKAIHQEWEKAKKLRRK
jgi:1-acyl-sn-glycerol-3-phosphate acyltransferase